MMYAITGGGTGGHLTIARALKNEIVARGGKVVFIGSTNGQDREWFENDSDFIEKIFLPSYGVTNQKGWGKVQSVANILKLAFSLNPLFRKYRFRGVISVGGYSSAPASIFAVLKRVPLYIHEQNASIGKFNRVMRLFAKEFFSSYLESSKVRDYPIPNIFFETRRVRKKIEKVIFLGGSQGAKFINDFAIRVAPELHKRGIEIIHQTGKRDFERMKTAYSKIEIEAHLIDFHPKLSKYIAQSDLAISRSGASTLWELSANGLPALFIPYPFANNHQWFNAKFIHDKGLGWVYPQNEIRPDHLLEILDEDLEEKSRKLMEMIQPDGAKKIVDIIFSQTAPS